MGTALSVQIISGRIAAAAGTGGQTAASYWTPTQFDTNVEAFAKCVSPADTNGGQGVLLSYLPGPNTGYMIFWQGSWIIHRIDPALVVIGNFPGTCSAGDVIGGRIFNEQVIIYKNGVAMGSVYDTTYRRSGYIGAYCGAWHNDLDNFGGGTVLPEATPAPPIPLTGRRTSW